MNQTITATLNAARSAESSLVAAVLGAADALDTVARDPLADALARLRQAADGARSRLDAGRLMATSMLMDALSGFEEFTAEVNAPIEEPAPVVTLSAPVEIEETVTRLEPEASQEGREREEVVTVAANPSQAAPATAPLALEPRTPAERSAAADAVSRELASRWNALTDPTNPDHDGEEGEPGAPVGKSKGRPRGRKAK